MVDHGVHADLDHKQDQLRNVLRHLNEIQQLFAAFIHSNFRV